MIHNVMITILFSGVHIYNNNQESHAAGFLGLYETGWCSFTSRVQVHRNAADGGTYNHRRRWYRPETEQRRERSGEDDGCRGGEALPDVVGEPGVEAGYRRVGIGAWA